MKLKRGQAEELSELTGISRQQIHRILNGERNIESKSGKKIFKALEIMKSNREKMEEEIKIAMEKIDEEFIKK